MADKGQNLSDLNQEALDMASHGIFSLKLSGDHESQHALVNGEHSRFQSD